MVSQAIELNEQLQKALIKHDALLSVRAVSTPASFDHEETEEEDADCLFRRCVLFPCYDNCVVGS